MDINAQPSIRSGLRAVFIGGETGHDRINERVMNKGLTREDLVWTIRALREAGARENQLVDIALAMIYPTPRIDGVSMRTCWPRIWRWWTRRGPTR